MTGQELAKLVKVYFEESYKYYVLYVDNSISDQEYDMICHKLLVNFDSIPTCYSKHLDKDLLRAGSGFSITMDTYKALEDENLINHLLFKSEF